MAVAGPVPRGLPALGLPALGWHDAGALLGVVVSISVVILGESAATPGYAGKYEEPFSEATDLVGLGAANTPPRSAARSWSTAARRKRR